MGGLRQGHKAIPVALGIADMHAHAHRINIADLQPQLFAQAQAQVIEDEDEHPVTEHAGGRDGRGKPVHSPIIERATDCGLPLALGRIITLYINHGLHYYSA